MLSSRSSHPTLDAAERVFYRQGVVRTSLQEIAEEANVTRGAVYWHFRDKIDLFHAMAERTVLPLGDLLEKLADKASDHPLTDLRRSCLETLDKMLNNQQSRRLFVILSQRCEYVEEMAGIVKKRRTNLERIVACHERFFKRARELGQLRPDLAPHKAALMLHALMYGLLSQGLDYKPTAALNRVHADCVTAFFNTLKTGGKRS